MNLYLLGMISFLLVFIVSIFLLIYFIKDEKSLKEVTNQELVKLGKIYTKEEFENKIFELYANILTNITYENYTFLKDSVADQVYNEILLMAKKNRDNKEESIISNIKKEFSKLISFKVENDLEVAKVWVRYSSIEYVKGIRKTVDENGKELLVEAIVDGNSNKPVNHEYILTFVKNRTQNENVICPNCGFQSHILLSSKCIRCDLEIVPKKQHWVYVGKVTTSISKEKK